ncbi:hypothetical protein E3N88_25958 [Mikania micrantha]|uniref:CCHC-type domain-containing protein n=1 Tax=Mikania micrantha TaxID=192012 RepID=A0A5N6N674_9ASTR|nr:hypothetical protein E3N88_25958 [Mikania micrantha]
MLFENITIEKPLGRQVEPVTAALATLITEQLVAIIPVIINRIRSSEEYARGFPPVTTKGIEHAKGDTSKKHKNHSTKKQKRSASYTEATPINQVMPDPTAMGGKIYKGKAALCQLCQYHHHANVQCRQRVFCGKIVHWVSHCRYAVESPRAGVYFQCHECGLYHDRNKPCNHCLNCGKKGHLIQECRNLPTQNQKQRASTSTSSQHKHHCYTCGMLGHFARDCPMRKFPTTSTVPTTSTTPEELLALPAPDVHAESDDFKGPTNVSSKGSLDGEAAVPFEWLHPI